MPAATCRDGNGGAKRPAETQQALPDFGGTTQRPVAENAPTGSFESHGAFLIKVVWGLDERHSRQTVVSADNSPAAFSGKAIPF